MDEDTVVTEVETPEGEAPAAEGAAAPEGNAAPETTMADAIEEGIESASGAPKPADKPAGEVESEEGGEAGKGEKKADGEDPAKAGAAAEGDDKKDEKKEPDHVNDPIPPGVSERTRERITALSGMVKQRDADLEVQGQLITSIQETGATPEQFGDVIGYLKLINSNDPADHEMAYQGLRNQMRELALKMGKAVPEIDFLEGHQDLKDEVKYGQITEARAREIAIQRGRDAAAAARTKKTTEATQDFETAKTAAITELNELGALLAASDPDYQAKYDEIVPRLVKEFEKVPPKQWRAEFAKAYQASKAKVKPAAAAPAAAAPAGDGKPKPTPIRPVQPAGSSGSKGAPKSMLEAINGALEGR